MKSNEMHERAVEMVRKREKMRCFWCKNKNKMTMSLLWIHRERIFYYFFFLLLSSRQCNGCSLSRLFLLGEMKNMRLLSVVGMWRWVCVSVLHAIQIVIRNCIDEQCALWQWKEMKREREKNMVFSIKRFKGELLFIRIEWVSWRHLAR